MKRLMIILLLLIHLLAMVGCSAFTPGKSGGFIRKTYTGTVEELLLNEDQEYIRVDVGDGEVIDFLLDDDTEFSKEVPVSAGDTVEIDCVLWYKTSTYSVLKLIVVD